MFAHEYFAKFRLYLRHNSLREMEKYQIFSAEMFSDELRRFDNASVDIYPDDDIWNDVYEEVV